MEIKLKDIEDIKTSNMARTNAEIKKLYQNWAEEVGEKIDKFSRKTNSSAPLSAANYKAIKSQLEESIKVLDGNIESIITNSCYTMSDDVVSAGSVWLESLGIIPGNAFSSIANDAVLRVLQGQVYEDGHSLSSMIWGNSKKDLNKIYETVAAGMAQNKSIAEISKGLEQFVNPSKRLAWKGPKGGMAIYPYRVDYNAQRLARTLIQHSYQQSLVATTKDNPFIDMYIWRANGSRACEICLARDGKKYKKNNLPLDHPNGMCEIDLDVEDNYEERLADWVNGKEDKELQDFVNKIEGRSVASALPKPSAAKSNVVNNVVKDRVYKSLNENEAVSIIKEASQEFLDIDEPSIANAYGHITGGGGYVRTPKSFDINEYLRNLPNGAAIDEYSKEIGDLDLLMGIVGMGDDVQMVRYVDNDAIMSILGVDVNDIAANFSASINAFENSVRDVSNDLFKTVWFNSTDDDVVSTVANLEKLKELVDSKYVGTVVENKQYLSVSLVDDLNLFTMRNVKIKMNVPKEAKLLITNNVDESEVILARNSKQVIKGINLVEEEAFNKKYYKVEIEVDILID